MIRTNNIPLAFFAFILIFLIAWGCAQQGGGNLIGGDKDTDPPVIVSSTPENYCTNFSGDEFEFEFDEYFTLKNINQKLIISPPMDEKPEINVRGKKLQIKFLTELLPDVTYTINFADALVDLNESNPYENFMVVFSTGDQIDSLEMQGIVVDALSGEPAEGVAVMLYSVDEGSRLKASPGLDPGAQVSSKLEGEKVKEDSIAVSAVDSLTTILRGDSTDLSNHEDTLSTSGIPLSESLQSSSSIDSLPLTSLPLYVSITNKEGKYHLKNLAGGKYKLFALMDANNNYKFDQATEKVAYLDELVEGSWLKAQNSGMDEGERPVMDSIRGDSIMVSEAILDTVGYKMVRGDTIPEYQIPNTDSLPPATSNQQPATKLRLFLEQPPNQKINTTERKQADKITVVFDQELDTIDINLLYAEDISGGYLVEWAEKRDSLVFWITDSLISNRDSVFYSFGYWGYDSLEQKEWRLDTLKFNFRHSAAKEEEKNPMTIRSNTGRTKELGVPYLLNFGLPVKEIDTSLISLFRIRDSLEFEENIRIKNINPPPDLPGLDKGLFVTNSLAVDKAFLPDSSYSLRVLPGAFSGYFGHTNDSLNLDFKVNTPDKYGSIIMKVDSLSEPAVLLLLDAKKKPLDERILTGSATETFTMLKPGKYHFKLILDKNGNGKWDTGRYIKKTQPEPILFYTKEITLKANWEMEENWVLEKNL